MRNQYARPCSDGGACTEKGMAIPGFCKCKEDSERVAELEAAIKAFVATYEGMACYGPAAEALKKLASK